MDDNQITALGKLQANGRQVNNAKTPQNLADCDIPSDNMLKDNLSDNLRLGIAARILAALFANPNIYMGPERKKRAVETALEFADALIEESKKIVTDD